MTYLSVLPDKEPKLFALAKYGLLYIRKLNIMYNNIMYESTKYTN